AAYRSANVPRRFAHRCTPQEFQSSASAASATTSTFFARPATFSRDSHSDAMRILIYLGTGGVGKTSVSAATALHHARRGLKSLVLTTEAAGRLRTALQMQEGMLQEQVRLDPPASGELWAEMLDVRGTLDEAVRLNTEADLGERILKHPIYASIAS